MAFTIATDGPEMMRTHRRAEFELLLKIRAVDEAQLGEANRRGHEASFVRRGSTHVSPDARAPKRLVGELDPRES